MLDKPSISYWGGALLGARKDQQDTFLVHDIDASGGLLAIVADGMGGQAAGGLASQVAAQAFRDTFVQLHASGGGLDTVFDGALHAANTAIHRAQDGRSDREGMGTTLLAVHVSPRGLSWISVGDSPLLLGRNEGVSRLNDDHSLRGLPEFTGGPHGNMLRSALTGQDIALIDRQIQPVPLSSDDLLVLASDGILTLEEPDIIALLSLRDTRAPEGIGQRLLDSVSEKGDPRQDNCTVVAICNFPAGVDKALPPLPIPASRSMPTWMIVFLACIAVALTVEAVIAWFW